MFIMMLHPKHALSVLAAAAFFVTACGDNPTEADNGKETVTCPESETPDPVTDPDSETRDTRLSDLPLLSFNRELRTTDIDGNCTDDLILADKQEVSPVDISGSASQGNLRIAIEDTFTLSITDVAQIDPVVVVGTECADEHLAVLRDSGVLDTPLTGDLLLELDQHDASLRIRLTDVDVDGEKWFVTVFRTVNQPPSVIEQTTGERISVRQRNAKIVFPVEHPEDPNNTDIGCRVNLHFVIEGLD